MNLEKAIRKAKELVDFLMKNYPDRKFDICFYSKHYYYNSEEFKKQGNGLLDIITNLLIIIT